MRLVRVYVQIEIPVQKGNLISMFFIEVAKNSVKKFPD